jgi:hypothetical protein
MRKWTADRFAALSGIVFAVLVLVGSFLPGTPPKVTDKAGKIANFYLDNHRGGLIGVFLISLGIVALLWFIGALSSAMRNAGEARLAGTALGAAVATIAVAGINGVITTALLFDVPRDRQLVHTLYVIAVVASTLIGFPAGAWVAATAIVAWRTRFLPRNYALLSGLAALVIASSGGALLHNGFYSPTGAYSIIAMIVTFAWVVATSALLATRREAAPAV